MDTDTLTPTERDVLITPGWPKGFCPIHVFSDRQCTSTCMAAHVALRQLQDDYDRHWARIERERVETA